MLADPPASIQQLDGAVVVLPPSPPQPVDICDLVRGTCPVTGEEAGWDLPPGVLRPPDRVRHPYDGALRVGHFERMGDYRNEVVYRFTKNRKRQFRDLVIRYHPSVSRNDRVSR